MSEQKHKRLYLTRIGIVLMVCAIVGAIALYMWGHRADRWSGSWDDMVATIYIVYLCVPAFIVGCVIAIIGATGKKKQEG